MGIYVRFEMDNQVFPVSKQLMEGPGEDLFDYIAKCLHDFAVSRGIDKQVRALSHKIILSII